MIEIMKRHGSTLVNPIYHWEDADIWGYIRQEKINTNPLYQCGYDRVGCIGCPLAPYHHRLKEFTDFPKYKGLYIKTFDRMIIVRQQRGKLNAWKNGQDVFDWWIEEYKHNVKGQMTLDDYFKED